jgi:hypothetical protein
MHKLPSFDLVKELVTKLVDPELDLFFSEREEIAKVLTDAYSYALNQDDIIDDLYDTAIDYGFMLKKAIGDDVGAVVPDWLSEDLDDVTYSRPTLKVSYAPKGRLDKADSRLIKAAKTTPAFGGVDVDVKSRYVGFEFETTGEALEAQERLQKKGYAVELLGC